MHGSPSPSAPAAPPVPGRERIRTELEALLIRVISQHPDALAADEPADRDRADALLATRLMDAYRITRDGVAFDGLVQWAGPHLRARIRTRLRCCGVRLDPEEVWQDTIVNIFRYPDRFQASRPGAFAAWSSTIVDNVIRRQLRDARRGLPIAPRDPELLLEHIDEGAVDPGRHAADREDCRTAASAYCVVLQTYLHAYGRLSDRERLVLQLVEVDRLRYADAAKVVGGRPEALKMVVFRARKRLHAGIQRLLEGPRAEAVAGPRPPRAAAAVS